MNAMILAAGRGERLRPFTDSCPKPLLEVHRKPLIEYHLEALAAAGIKSVVINVSWLAQQIELALGDGSRFDLDIVYSREKEALETAGGVIQALPYLEDNFIVLNADIYTDYPLQNLLHLDELAHLVLVPNPEHHLSGDFSYDHGLLGSDSANRYTFSGISCYQKLFFSGKHKGRQALSPLLYAAADEGVLSGEIYQGRWVDVGTVERWQTL
jgi:MurNAc alpha-1-phosphate uridylyltransferase